MSEALRLEWRLSLDLVHGINKRNEQCYSTLKEIREFLSDTRFQAKFKEDERQKLAVQVNTELKSITDESDEIKQYLAALLARVEFSN